ncbi:uncharacterized protein [Diadema antillarum]|uniref:uncharacterized protein n=1 Tax=Diadema antillarum TaxID=105358 RepID=UPI003A83EC16
MVCVDGTWSPKQPPVCQVKTTARSTTLEKSTSADPTTIMTESPTTLNPSTEGPRTTLPRQMTSTAVNDVTSLPQFTERGTTAPTQDSATTFQDSLTTNRVTAAPPKPTTELIGCKLPDNLDPDITISDVKSRYDVTDFILLYCPPPPYIQEGVVFSSCTSFGWVPSIDNNACYAPCTAPSVPESLIHFESSSGETLETYEHEDVLEFACADPSKDVDVIINPTCNDGDWEGLVYPSCEDPVCTIPDDLDPDILLSPEEGEFGEDDVLLLYCPPPPFTSSGTPFSVCRNGVWEPDLSENACYAPCEPPEVEERVKYSLQGGLLYKGQYEHESVLSFNCSQGVLNGATNMACLDGSWSPATPPVCVDVTTPTESTTTLQETTEQTTVVTTATVDVTTERATTAQPTVHTTKATKTLLPQAATTDLTFPTTKHEATKESTTLAVPTTTTPGIL